MSNDFTRYTVCNGIKIYQKLFKKGLTFWGVRDIIMIESKENKPTGRR